MSSCTATPRVQPPNISVPLPPLPKPRQLPPRALAISLLHIPVIGSIARADQRLNCSMRGMPLRDAEAPLPPHNANAMLGCAFCRTPQPSREAMGAALKAKKSALACAQPSSGKGRHWRWDGGDENYAVAFATASAVVSLPPPARPFNAHIIASVNISPRTNLITTGTCS